MVASGADRRDGFGQPDGRRRGPATWLLAVLALGIALIAGSLGAGLGLLAADAREPVSGSEIFDGASLGAAPEGTIDRAPDSVAGVSAKVLPSVVSIAVSNGGQQGTGSGFVLSADGLIITNNHVVEAASGGGEIEVAFADGKRAPATIVGRDAGYDLAVLRVKAQNLPPLPLGSSENVQVGDPVIAIGSPLGLAGTVTLGIVSAKDRPVTAGQGDSDASYISAIQTDAAINPGNSGGPLVNLAGEVVGVNSAIATLGAGSIVGQSGSIGLGFAIPIDQARRTAEQLIQGGVAVRPVIGASLDSRYTGEGAKIAEAPAQDGTPPLTPGGPAEQAGVEPGDVVLALDGKPVQGNEELIVAIRSHVPGETVTLRVRRGSEEQEITVVLGEAER
jgi:putative serine protease PepD